MKLLSNRYRVRLAALGFACCLGFAFSPAARAQDDAITAQTLIDRAQIEDLITRYYYNFGKSSPESFAEFYAEDAEMILGANVYEGREGIEGAYAAARQNGPGQASFSFNVVPSNVLIVVNGDTATAQLVFTEYVIDEQGQAPHIRTQGREYDRFVKVNGEWRLKSRRIMPGDQTPEGWPE